MLGRLGFLLLLLLTAPVRAHAIEMGAVCDTHKQTERLASPITEDAEIALQTLNAEEHYATACEYLNVAFVRSSQPAAWQRSHRRAALFDVYSPPGQNRAGILCPKPLERFTLARAVPTYWLYTEGDNRIVLWFNVIRRGSALQ
jgi:hypothetical protein